MNLQDATFALSMIAILSLLVPLEYLKKKQNAVVWGEAISLKLLQEYPK